MNLVYGTSLGVARINCVRKLISMKAKEFKTWEPDNVQISDLDFDGVPVRYYKPDTSASENSPAIVFIHGGGWTLGSVDMYDETCFWLTTNSSLPVISIEYRLAPEHVFPAAFEDSLAATLHFMKHAGQFGVDPDRIVIMGDSAGGNLAAAVTLQLRDLNMASPPKLQILIYPAVQAFNFMLPSSMSENQVFLLSDQVAQFWLLYAKGDDKYKDVLLQNKHTTSAARLEFGSLVDANNLPREFVPADYHDESGDGDANEIWSELQEVFVDPRFAPGLARDLSNLPKTYILTVANDPIRDDGVLYAQRLTQAGNDVTHEHFSNGFHAVLSTPQFVECIKSRQMIIDFLTENV